MSDSTADSATTTAADSQLPAVNPPDKHIWGIYLALVTLSIIELYSASSFEISKQGLFAPILRHAGQLFVGFLIILGLQRVHYRWFIPVIPLFALISAGMMIYVMFFGEIVNGARRAFSLPGFSVQPSEFIKLSAVLVVALVLSRTQLRKSARTRNIGICVAAGSVLFFGGLLFNQGMTNTILLMAISMSMMLVGAIEWRKLFCVVMVYGMIASGALYFKMKHHKDDAAKPDTTIVVKDPKTGRQISIERGTDPGKTVNRSSTWKDRIAAWRNDSVPKYDQKITTENLQEMRSYMAQANGGWHGVFPGNSRETSRLPLAFSDYIYAIIIEDLGLIGGIFVMVLYLWLLARAHNIARRCSQAFPAFLVTGMAVLITFQALFHMAIVSGYFPVSGQPLPLFSKAGTSILVTSIAFGIMLSVSRYAVRSGKRREIKQEANALPESVRGENPSQF